MGNFEYLENKIIATANSIATGNSTVASQLLTISDTLINKMAQLPQSSQISGFIITKKDDTTITVSKGSCYDSTMTTILNLDTSKDVTNNSQAVSKTYYVYVISNSTGSNIDIYLDTATVPSAPSGYTLYRTIGSYTTNANGVIDKISYFGIDSNSDKNNSSAITNGAMPDYAKKVGKSTGTSYKADTSGWLFVQTGKSDDKSDFSVVIDGITFRTCGNTTASEHFYFNLMLPVGKGSTYQVNKGGYSLTVYFIPCKGV